MLGKALQDFTYNVDGDTTSMVVRLEMVTTSGDEVVLADNVRIVGDLVSVGGTTNVPTVTTRAISNITVTAAAGGGEITTNGGASVTARGVCISTSANPQTNDTCTTDGTGDGNFQQYAVLVNTRADLLCGSLCGERRGRWVWGGCFVHHHMFFPHLPHLQQPIFKMKRFTRIGP